MAVEERLIKLEMRQEALIASMQGLLAIQTDIRDMIAELSAWLRQPASTDLPDLSMAAWTRAFLARAA